MRRGQRITGAEWRPKAPSTRSFSHSTIGCWGQRYCNAGQESSPALACRASSIASRHPVLVGAKRVDIGRVAHLEWKRGLELLLQTEGRRDPDGLQFVVCLVVRELFLLRQRLECGDCDS